MVVVVVVVVTGMVVRTVIGRARGAVYMCGAVRMIVIVIVVVTRIAVCGVAMRTRGAVPMRITVRMVVIVAAVVMVVAVCCGLAVRALAGRRRRVGNGRRLRVARVGAARIGAACMTVSWVVGTLGVGHDNLLNGFQWLDGVQLTP